MHARWLVALALPAAGWAAEAPRYSLTVYSSAQPGQVSIENLANYGMQLPGYALVRDERALRLEQGSNRVAFTDVAKRIDPTTVGFASLTDPAGTRVIEQNYQFDLVDNAKLVQRYLGENITVEQPRGDALTTISGKLLSAAGGLIIEQPNGEVVTLNSYGNIRFPSLPGGLITKPTLVWLIHANQAGDHRAQVSYQTEGMTWWSDYNVHLRSKGEDCALDLAGWVTVINRSGASFTDTQLKLVAGAVNRVASGGDFGRDRAFASESIALDGAAKGFQESALSEYHLYTLGRRTDLPDYSSKQLELFPAARAVACRKQLVFTAMPHPWQYLSQPITDQSYAATNPGTVGVYLEFDNKEANHLGIPLPAGRMRVNQAAADGALEFIGEDLIKHTPRNEHVRIKLGEAFDVVGERKQISYHYDSAGKSVTEGFEISVRNRKNKPVTVLAREYLYRWSNWTIIAQSHPYQKRDAATIDFPLTLAADSEAKLSYTVRYHW